jgi:hypothetical protein
MSSRGNLHPWFVVGLGVLLFAVLPLVRKVTGSTSHMDPLDGTWVGRVHFSDNDPSRWTGISGPHKEGVFSVTLKAHHNMPNYYDGNGEIGIAGDHGSRPLRAFNFVRDAQGTLHMDFNFDRGSSDLTGQSNSLTGHLHNGSLLFHAGDEAAPTMTLELHQGSATEFQQLMAKQAATAH